MNSPSFSQYMSFIIVRLRFIKTGHRMTLEPEKNGSNQEETSTYDFQKNEISVTESILTNMHTVHTT